MANVFRFSSIKFGQGTMRKYGKLELTKECFEQMDLSLSKATLAVSFLSQEMRELIQLIDAAQVEECSDKRAQHMMTVQRSFLVRLLGVKVEAFMDVWKYNLANPTSRKADESGVLEELYQQHCDAVVELEALPGKEVLAHVRNRIAAHVDRDAIAASIEVLDPDWVFECYFDAADPFNSFFPFAEEIVFGAGLQHRRGRKDPGGEFLGPLDGVVSLQNMQDYVVKVTMLALNYCHKLLHLLAQRVLGMESVPFVSIDVPENRQAKLEECRLPLYSVS